MSDARVFRVRRGKPTGVMQTCFDTLSERFAGDLDPELVRRAEAKTPAERILWLEEMQSFGEAARKAREHEASRPPSPTR